MTKFLHALTALLLTTTAQAQTTVRQSGNITPGHAAMWTTTGVIQDAGVATNGFLTSIGILNAGPGICQNTARNTGPFYQFCMGVTSGGIGTISVNGFGGAINPSFQFIINGSTYAFPFTVGGIVGPTTSVIGHLAKWNNTTGSLLEDGGQLPQINVQDYASGVDITNGINDAGPAFQAAINACDHCIIQVPNINTATGATATCYNIVTPLTGHAHMSIEGTTNENAHLNGTDAGSALCVGQSSAPMFTFPGATNIDDDIAVGWAFRRLRFDGKSVNQPLIYAPEAVPGRGTWSAVIEQNVFSNCKQCISAQNGWDWWVRDNSFNLSGNGSITAALNIFNSSQNYGGAGSNSWHITNNAFDVSVGRAINFDSSGIGAANQFMIVTDNKFGPQGYESISGCLLLSVVANNESEGSTTGLSIINLTGTNGGTTGCGRNRIIGNTLAAPGVYAINDAGSLDIITDNMFYLNGSGSAYINLTGAAAINTITNNKTNDAMCCNSVPIVNDGGSSTSVYHNDGSDGVVTRQYLPEKLAGSQFYVPLFSSNTYQLDGAWTSYTPTLSCVSGTLGAGSATGAYKRMGNTVFVTINPVVGGSGVGTCVNLQATLPFTAALVGVLAGKETVVTGKAVTAAFNGASNVALIQDYTGNSFVANSYNYTISGVFASQ